MKQQLNSHMFEGMYKDLGIDINKLGCVMIDMKKGLDMPNMYSYEPESFYQAKNPDHFWIKGYVGDKTPHVTLLYGLMEKAHEYEKEISIVMKGWDLKTVKGKDIGYFESALPDEDYYCIVAMIEVSPELKEGMERLEFLPHINTFAEYCPHLTIAYIRKDDILRDRIISDLRALFSGKELEVSPKLNLGSNK